MRRERLALASRELVKVYTPSYMALAMTVGVMRRPYRRYWAPGWSSLKRALPVSF